ncbi:MAG: DUF4012 domain-containing protein [Patescibacteria group bacterium]|nr:DUF4012 domain-containing protein [Patescibacteria group bacterium]
MAKVKLQKNRVKTAKANIVKKKVKQKAVKKNLIKKTQAKKPIVKKKVKVKGKVIKPVKKIVRKRLPAKKKVVKKIENKIKDTKKIKTVSREKPLTKKKDIIKKFDIKKKKSKKIIDKIKKRANCKKKLSVKIEKQSEDNSLNLAKKEISEIQEKIVILKEQDNKYQRIKKYDFLELAALVNRESSTNEIKRNIKSAKSKFFFHKFQKFFYRKRQHAIGGQKEYLGDNSAVVLPQTSKNFSKIKLNFLNRGVSIESKLGFWRTLIFPLYTLWKGLENFFISLSNLSRGRLPNVFRFSLPSFWSRSLIAFVTICFILVLPFEAAFVYKANLYEKGKVLGQAKSAMGELKAGGEYAVENNLIEAGKHFNRSFENFKYAQKTLDNSNSMLVKVFKNIPADGGIVLSGDNLLSFGENISKAACRLNGSLGTILEREDTIFRKDNILINEKDTPIFAFRKGFLTEISGLLENTLLVKRDLEAALENINRVKLNALNNEQKQTLLLIKEKLPNIISIVGDFNELLDVGIEILGKDNFKQYLILFQNNYELRATGGFIGSFAVMDIDQGRIKKIYIPEGGSYDVRGGLTKRISSPIPLHLVSPLWQFHDANWWPDFPTSARKLMEFYEVSGGSTVDGVIAITPEIIIDLLKITGPIDMEEYGKVVDADNFMWTAQYYVELEYDKEGNKPKKFIADFTSILISKLSESFEDGSINMMDIFEILEKQAQSKGMQFYFTNQDAQKIVEENFLGGEIKQSSGDYLMVVNSNIAGGKTDGVISQSIKLNTTVENDGTAVNQLTIKRAHNGDYEDYFQRDRNVNWIRIYVPEGSKLVSADGFKNPDSKFFQEPEAKLDIDQDLAELDSEFKIDKLSGIKIYNQFGKTVFAGWSMVDVGETTEIELEYELPFKVEQNVNGGNEKQSDGLIYSIFDKFSGSSDLVEDDNFCSYLLLMQKQAGITSQFRHFLNTPQNWQPVWKNTEQFSGVLDKDKIYGEIFKIE